MLILRLLLLISANVSIFSQFATLTLPSNIKSGKVLCNSPFAGALVTYTTSFPTVFGTIPVMGLGISTLSITPGLSIYLRSRITSTTTTNFIVEIGFGVSTTTFSTINFNYLAANPTTYNTAAYAPFYFQQLQWTGSKISSLGLGTGNRAWEISFARVFSPVLAGTDMIMHNVVCSALLLGFTGTTTDYEYSIENSCYCSNLLGGASLLCYYRAVVKKNTHLTNLLIRFFMVDTLMLEMVHTTMAQFWTQTYQNGLTSNSIPTSYLPATTAMFTGLNSLAINGSTLQTLDIDYPTNLFTVPTNYKATFHYLFISITSCHSGSMGSTGVRKCFNGYNGCSFASFSTISSPKSNVLCKISQSNKYIFTCSTQGLDIYKHDGVGYVLYQTIFLKFGCRSIAPNKDFSIFVVADSTYGANLFELFTFNTTTLLWQSKYRVENDGSVVTSGGIAISDNGQTVVVSVLLTSSPPAYIVQHYEFNSTINQYELISQETIYSLIMKIKLVTESSGDIRLVLVLAYGTKIVQGKKTYKSGRFYNVSTQKLVPNNLTIGHSTGMYSKFVWSRNGDVIAVQSEVFYGAITIYHYNSTTLLYEKHSTIRYEVTTYSTNLVMDYDGLNLAVYAKDSSGYYMIIYRRNSLLDEFIVIATQRPFASTVTTSMIDITKQTIVVVDQTSAVQVVKIYSCGVSVVSVVQPQNGNDLMDAIVMEAQITPTDLKLQNLTNQTTTIKTNLTLVTSQSISLSAQAVAVENSLNQTQQNFTTSLQGVQHNLSNSLREVQQNLSEQIKSAQQLNDSNEQQNNTLFAVIFSIIGVLSVILGVLGSIVLKNKCVQSVNQKPLNSCITNETHGDNLKSTQSLQYGLNSSTIKIQPYTTANSIVQLNNQIPTVFSEGSLTTILDTQQVSLSKPRKKRQKTNRKASNKIQPVDTVNCEQIESLENYNEY